MFTGQNLEVNHLKIFGFLVYLHAPKQKISKLDPLGKKGIFVGYSDQSKAYIIYILGFRQIEGSIEVTFDEDATFKKYRKIHADEVYEEEQEAPIIVEASKLPVRYDEEEPIPEYHDIEEPQEPIESLHEIISTRRRPSWCCDIT